ncbi:hypothetical protein [Rhodopirellula bahusiensis]|uniref:Cytochrome c domain-containing protein n=1 Tax=Rhodopirellula bahusiensis TaxID=2014065 RepID=A0A2G1W8Q0_9BACT|nr:hypothetical protein [Rhodopirellula bahusiensis]PHQ35412.1 hypothetical protein CEE69_10425 [Rhodopirellula bahusiensis]
MVSPHSNGAAPSRLSHRVAVRNERFIYGGLLCWIALLATPAWAQPDFERPPIDYLNAEVNDPVARLAKRIAEGEVALSSDPKFGYLPSVLEALDVPLSSQTLVFSKTSLQLHRISPRRPRALYFNDDVYVGYCQHGDVLEFASTDAKQGAIFYTLSQSDEKEPEFVRDRGGCLSCHASSRTQNVPGFLIRSVFADAAGRPKLGSGTFTTDHTSPFDERWGGWYVTGSHGSMRHMGNVICTDEAHELDRESGANQGELGSYFRTESYLTPHSDIVALMVLEHQTQMHNAITAANFETRQALHQSYQMNELLEREPEFISESATRRIESSADRVLKYLLMCDEFELTDSVAGTSTFAREFAAIGPTDLKQRSLREFDLETRLFRYPCSYLIYSDSFAALPDEVRTRVLEKLKRILDGEDQSETYQHLTSKMRREILEILKATHSDFQ